LPKELLWRQNDRVLLETVMPPLGKEILGVSLILFSNGKDFLFFIKRGVKRIKYNVGLFWPVLFLVSLVFFASCSKDPVDQHIREYLEEGQSITRLKTLENQVVQQVCLVKDRDGNPVKLFQILFTSGYKDNIKILAEFNLTEDSLSGIRIIEHHETYNYGGYAAEDWFLRRFEGKGVGKDLKIVKLAAKEPEDIVCLTGATITTAGIVDGVNKGLAAYRNYKEGE
jgi:Na+-translocating ferredoxin:NAD+ oxidoreductase RnfG subunit